MRANLIDYVGRLIIVIKDTLPNPGPQSSEILLLEIVDESFGEQDLRSGLHLRERSQNGIIQVKWDT